VPRAEPQLLCDEVPWAYNEAVYQVEVDGLAISFVVAPATRDVRLIARRGERRVFELCAVGVADVRVDDERGVDAIKVQLSAGSWVRVQLRPTFEVMQGSSRRAEQCVTPDTGDNRGH
jgi:hypothetical protein